MKWRPISEAKRDGTIYLLGRFTGNPKADHEGEVAVDWYRTNYVKHGYLGWGQFNPQYWPPTHFCEIIPPEGVSCVLDCR